MLETLPTRRFDSEKVAQPLVIPKETEEFNFTTWSSAWRSAAFRFKFILGFGLLILLVCCYPYFFSYIQNRNGVLLHDRLLAIIPSVDVSMSIFSVICFSLILGFNRTLRSPQLFLVFLWGYFFMSLSRVVTILLVPLDPPIGLQPLLDPIAGPFYGHGNDITKDLFYSGHTGALFLIYLIMQKKWEKALTLIGTVIIAILLLIQHIHYSLDVFAAPFFVYIVYLAAKKVAYA